MRQFVDTSQAAVVDVRSIGGEVIRIPLLYPMQFRDALKPVAVNLSWYMQKVTGRGYEKAEEVYDAGYTVREPGHNAFGLKVFKEEASIIIARVAVLEDESIFKRYVEYVKTGVLL